MKALILMTLTVILTSCASTYTPVDKTNMDRFTHDQKISVDMTAREVMGMFGSPDRVIKGNTTFKFVYYRKIQCAGVYCTIDFKDGEVVGYNSFRQEYINFID